ncbi:hypothetical protein ACLOJK_034605 [Asimina triloba]
MEMGLSPAAIVCRSSTDCCRCSSAVRIWEGAEFVAAVRPSSPCCSCLPSASATEVVLAVGSRRGWVWKLLATGSATEALQLLVRHRICHAIVWEEGWVAVAGEDVAARRLAIYRPPARAAAVDRARTEGYDVVRHCVAAVHR